MIYIISGISRSGKTLLARQLLAEYTLPYLSTDAVMMGFMLGLPETGVHDKLWPSDIAKRIWPFLRGVMETLIHEGTDFVLEGEAFTPELCRPFVDKYPNQVRVVFLGYPSATLNQKREEILRFPNGEHDWLLQQSDMEIDTHITNMIAYSNTIQASCDKHGFPFIDVTTDFITSLALAKRLLLQTKEL